MQVVAVVAHTSMVVGVVVMVELAAAVTAQMVVESELLEVQTQVVVAVVMVTQVA
jgi:hypothetical protein